MRQVSRIIPPLLCFVAGYVDSCTFLALFGLFVAQVTGSLVLAGTELIVLKPAALLRFVEIFAFFLAGVATTFMVRSAEERGGNTWTQVLALEGVLLSGLLISWIVNGPWLPNTPIVIFASLLGLSAMGVQSAFVTLLIQGSPSTNVMTTNVTQFAIDTTDLVLARWPRYREQTGTTAAQQAKIGRRWTSLWAVLLNFFWVRLQVPQPMFGSICGACCFLSPSSVSSAWAQFGCRVHEYTS